MGVPLVKTFLKKMTVTWYEG